MVGPNDPDSDTPGGLGAVRYRTLVQEEQGDSNWRYDFGGSIAGTPPPLDR